ncbi:MAG: NADP-dependent phosphogluconate dehydrogenase [bacterium]
MKKNEIGIIGTGVMGASLSKNFLSKGFNISVFDKDLEKLKKLDEQTNDSLTIFPNLISFVESLEIPRKIILMLPAGDITDSCLDELKDILSKGDIVMDGGNSFYKDTNRRYDYLNKFGINFFGVGISGGEKGALIGPSIMPGGNKDSYNKISSLLEVISAHKNDKPCCSYIGEGGAGHFIKMVHNGIEYADMQIIAEIYLFLKFAMNKTNLEISSILSDWNQTEVKSYLIEITSSILSEEDPKTKEDLIDLIVDASSNKGTGKWTSIESFELGINISTITSSLQARIISNFALEREVVGSYFNSIESDIANITLDELREAYYLSKVIAYTQGFSMMKQADSENNWNLNLENIASTFRAGCIIQAEFLELIVEVYKEDSSLTNLLLSSKIKDILIDNEPSLRNLVVLSITRRIPIPTINSALTYIDQLSSPLLGANLIQAQRDLFGAHTFSRKDTEGVFHHEWKQN